MIISIIVSAAAGCVLAVSLSTNGGNALVGTAISAGLLPPLVNAGMLISYSFVYAPVQREVSWLYKDIKLLFIYFDVFIHTCLNYLSYIYKYMCRLIYTKWATTVYSFTSHMW